MGVTDVRDATVVPDRTVDEQQLMLDGVTDYAVLRLDKNGIVKTWHRGAQNLQGYLADEIIGRHVSLFYTEEDRKSGLADRELRTAEDTGRFEYEGWRVRKDGSRFPANVVLTALRSPDGSLAGFVKVTRDTTAQSQYARSLIEASLDPLVTISPDGKITDVNEATVAVTGLPRVKLIGTDFSDYFTEPDEAREGYQRVFAEGSVTDYPLTIRHRDGRLTDVLYNASVYKDIAGNVLGVFAAARDVTARKQAEAEIAEQRAKELERLAELERFQKLTVGRELKMIELKKEIAELTKSTRREP